MRITVSHNKSKVEAIRLVNDAADQALRPILSGPIQMSDLQKRWSDSTMTFSLKVGFGGAQVPIKGSILVTERDVTIDCDLPPMLESFLPDAAKASVQATFQKLLN